MSMCVGESVWLSAFQCGYLNLVEEALSSIKERRDRKGFARTYGHMQRLIEPPVLLS